MTNPSARPERPEQRRLLPAAAHRLPLRAPLSVGIPCLLVLTVAAPMLIVAGLAHDRGMLFPEGASLGLGVLALCMPDWDASPVKLAVLPPTCAALGIALTYADLPRWIGELVAITVVLLLLQAGRSRITPALSAGAFPLVFDVHTWVYPLTALVVCGALAVVTAMRLPRRGSPTHAPSGRLRAPVAIAVWTVVAGWIVIAGPGLGLGAAAVAPPLIVGTVERLVAADRSVATALRHWTVIVAAAAAGAFGAADIVPRWAGGLIAPLTALVVFAFISGPHPPALAIGIIPQAVPIHSPTSFVIGIGIGAAVLYTASSLLGHGDGHGLRRAAAERADR